MHDKPAVVQGGRVLGRADMANAGPITRSVPWRDRFPARAGGGMAHQALDPAFRRLIDEHARVRQAGSGFAFTEGPIWHPVDHDLPFSDMPADMRRSLGVSGVREVMRPANKGIPCDAALNLLVCEHAISSVARFRPDGTRQAPASRFDGRELASPSGICVKSDGSIWFTDTLTWADAA